MDKTRLAILGLLTVALLFGTTIAGIIVYYNARIASLDSQVASLNNFIANLPAAHPVADLGIAEIPGNESNEMGQPTPIPYNYLYVTGFVNNTGEGTAYNAGLLVVAYDDAGMLRVNMTVPMSGGIFGVDNETKSYILEHYCPYDPVHRVHTNVFSSSLGVFNAKQVTYVAGSISILHEGTVTNWTVTPVWTNIP